jgi:hypothetical protein
MISIKQTALNVAVASALGLGAVGAAHAAAITSITITGGSFHNSQSTPNRVPFTFFGPNTDLVSGYLGAPGGNGISSFTQNPNSIGGFDHFGAPVNLYTAASSFGDLSPAGILPGGPVPTGDITNGVMTMDLSSWFANWNGQDFNQGSATASTDFVPTDVYGTAPADVAGSVSCVGTICTFENLEWQSLWVGGATNGATGTWTLSGTATIVPVPAAVWLFGSGLLGLAGMARRRTM